MSTRVLCVPRKRKWPAWCRHKVLSIKECPPFAETMTGRYAHRVRYAEMHLRDDGKTYVTATGWCGYSVFIQPAKRQRGGGGGRFVETPSEGRPICATCEGRAIGSGQLGSRVIAGREVMFQPQRSTT